MYDHAVNHLSSGQEVLAGQILRIESDRQYHQQAGNAQVADNLGKQLTDLRRKHNSLVAAISALSSSQ